MHNPSFENALASSNIHADWLAHLLFAFLKLSYLNLLQVKFQYSSIVSVAEETGLSIALSHPRRLISAIVINRFENIISKIATGEFSIF